MARRIVHRRAPEVILDEVSQRRLGQHVSVPHDCRYVVVHEVATQGIEVGAQGDKTDRQVDAPVGRLVARRAVSAARARARARAAITAATRLPLAAAATAGVVMTVAPSFHRVGWLTLLLLLLDGPDLHGPRYELIVNDGITADAPPSRSFYHPHADTEGREKV